MSKGTQLSRWLATLLAILFVTSSYAGHYEVTFAPQHGQIDFEQPPNFGGNGTLYYTQAQNGSFGAYKVAASTSSCLSYGAIQGTATWVNDTTSSNELPEGVLIDEYSEITIGLGGGQGDGWCDNGFGDEMVFNGFGQATSSGHRYTAIADPGQSFPVTAEPLGWIYCTDPTGGCTTLVYYKVTIHPVRINFGGTDVIDSKQKIQIGSKLTATIAGLPWAGENLDWTISGGHPFSDYNPEVVPTVYTGWSDPGTTQTQVYFGMPANDMPISCRIRYASLGVDFTIWKEVSVVGPTLGYRSKINPNDPNSPDGSPRKDRVYLMETWDETQGIDAERPVTQWSESTSAPDNWLPWGVVPLMSVTSNYKVGVGIQMWVASPPEFGNQFGHWAYAQTVNTKIEIATGGGQNSDYLRNKEHNLTRLDGQFPYLQDGGPWSAGNGDQHSKQWVDTPRTPKVIGLYPGANYFYRKDSFVLTIYYRPPGNGSNNKWVPVRQYSWNWVGRADRGSTWTLAGSPFSQNNPSLVSAVLFGLYTSYPVSFPAWTEVDSGYVDLENGPLPPP